MKRCSECRVKVNEVSNRCPLCFSSLEKIDDIKEEYTYPKVELSLKKYRNLFKILGVVSVIVCLLSIIANYMSFNGVKWSLLVVAGIIYWWISLAYSINKSVSTTLKIVIQAVLLSLLMICYDLAIGYTGISINYGLPTISINANLIILGIMIINRTNWKKYSMYQLTMCIIGFIPLIFIPFGLFYTYTPIVLSCIFCSVMFISTFVYRKSELKDEYIRRFHI